MVGARKCRERTGGGAGGNAEMWRRGKEERGGEGGNRASRNFQ